MNREIKFRAWDTKNKNWMEFIPPKEYMIDSDEWDWRDSGGDEASLFFPSNPIGPTFNNRIIYQQFTGIKDKNNKEIYEGDIIVFYTNINDKNISLVEYDNRNLCFLPRIEDVCVLNQKGEIIGNIFENPELLKKTE